MQCKRGVDGVTTALILTTVNSFQHRRRNRTLGSSKCRQERPDLDTKARTSKGRGCCQSPVLRETVEVVRMFLVKTAAFNETYAGLRPHTGERERPKPALTQPGSDASNDSNVTPKTPASRALRSRACSRGLFGRILRPRPNST